MNIDRILSAAVRGGASDILLKVGALPRFRFNGKLISLSDGSPVTVAMMQEWIEALVPPHQRAKLQELVDLDFSYQSGGGYRFRVNLFRQRQSWGIVLRIINNHLRTLEELQLPPVITNLTQQKRGLILVTGATGSGKTTTLAAMIEKINTTHHAHVITVEDPIEYIYSEKNSTINQREIGVDTASFSEALRSALRQNPDVILVGELRDSETTTTALMAAETGHLVMSTLHTKDAVESITRLMSYFEPHRHHQVRLALSQTLLAVVSQRLLTRQDGRGMVPAIEILMVNDHVREILVEGEDFTALHDIIGKGQDTWGMQSFDQSILDLYQRGVISKQQALENASNRKDFELTLRGVS